MATQASPSQAATERVALLMWPPIRGGIARATLAAGVLVCAALSTALLVASGRPTLSPGASGHGAASRLAGEAGAMAALSMALGARDHAYHALAAPGGYEVANPAQHLHARFGRAGVALSSGALRLSLNLRASGYAGRMRPLNGAPPRATSNKVSYAHPGLIEWYENGPLGLEQGFTLLRPPSSAAAGATLAVGVGGNARPSLDRLSGSVDFKHEGGRALRYRGLFAVDAGGRTLPTAIALQGSTLLLHVDTRGASYPVRVDPLVQQGEKLTGGPDEGATGLFGYAVALSSDGNTALVGAPRDGERVGAAWVFVRSGTTWTQQGPKLAGAGEVGEGRFGRSLALSSDGNTAVIGAPADGNHAGAAWVFQRSGSSWAQQGSKLAGGEEAGAFGHFGRAVALSADGNTALISAPNNLSGRGAVFVFERSGSTWLQQGAKIVGSALVGEAHFGGSVALSSDGTIAIVGGAGDDERAGAAWAFVHGVGGWTQQGLKLTGGEGAGPGAASCFEEATEGEEEEGGCGFGRSVALSSDGNTALVGGPRAGDQTGAAWVFQRSGTAWAQQGAALVAGAEIGQGKFGYSTALSSDGNTALIGGPGDDARTGAAWVFTRSGSAWTQLAHKPTPRDEQGRAGFGSAVALSADGETAIIGGPFERSKLGAAWVFAQGAEVENPIEEKHRGKRKESPDNAPTSGVLAFNSVGAICKLSRVSRKIAVQSRGRMALRLVWGGRGQCRGRLSLTAQLRRRGARSRTLTIARASFSQPAGRTGLLRLRLNARGRALLSSGHGRLGARLAVVTLDPRGTQARSASVLLAVPKKRSVRLVRH
jgi:hypothetical protein